MPRAPSNLKAACFEGRPALEARPLRRLGANRESIVREQGFDGSVEGQMRSPVGPLIQRGTYFEAKAGSNPVGERERRAPAFLANDDRAKGAAGVGRGVRRVGLPFPGPFDPPDSGTPPRCRNRQRDGCPRALPPPAVASGPQLPVPGRTPHLDRRLAFEE